MSELPLLLGVGEDARGDDAVGLRLVQRLAPRLAGRAELRECRGDPVELLELWADRADVRLLDAVRSGAPVGTIHRRLLGATELPALERHSSSHGLGVAEAIGLGRALGRMPSRLTLYGIEAGPLTYGAALSAPVAAAAERLEEELVAEFGARGSGIDRPGGG